MDGRRATAQRRAPGTARPLLLPLLAAVVALAVVAGAALAGPWHVAPREVELAPPPAEQETRPPAEEVEQEPPPEPGERGLPVTLLLAAAGLLLLALLLRALLRRATLARGSTAPPHDPALGTAVAPDPGEPEPDLPALRRGVAAARAVLASRGEPDDAVVAAWLELEAAAASSGVQRAPSDTPTELTTAVLDSTSADPVATRGLLRLYHRARFAPHAVLTAEDVAEAGRCLEQIAASWESR
ncbi:protein of unknown function [Georgenia satyanarayanai]|uniref:Protein-glutamine gamma-glutamyltransferase-like C-terminal domain-containing protein n=1 Tax=Georgenia satyanarayanai TaxID=860221 RepID=A0A2Y9A902_9MICO|nr:DUF4129 domain-containing protein [Georgenia satyanarayanai]PYG00299.1 uncharacterized protein DUF4129 [Georgenia satyanarayanai]SSA40685.1 protein of unknown function [Georgenia satyanarayanai]